MSNPRIRLSDEKPSENIIADIRDLVSLSEHKLSKIFSLYAVMQDFTSDFSAVAKEFAKDQDEPLGHF